MKVLSATLSLFLLCSSTALAAPAASSAPAANAAAEADDVKACRKFVQEFYDWYLKLSKRDDNKTDPSTTAITTKKDSFDATLIKKLKEDEEASAKSPDEIVGLDFDPFLNAQDMPRKYTTGKAVKKGDTYLVEVFGDWEGDTKKNKKADVTPELVSRNNHFVFINFRYPPSDIPENADLISVLNALKKSRDEDAKKTAASKSSTKGKASSSGKTAATSKPADKKK